MSHPKNAMEIFQHLDKSNCRKCGKKTCLAFAGAVMQSLARLDECPKLTPDIIARLSSAGPEEKTADQRRDEYLVDLRSKVAGIDLAEAAVRTGGEFSNGRLTLKILGKSFSADNHGNLIADIHVNPWVAIPFCNHVLTGRGILPNGNWVSFRELKNGMDHYPLFRQRCEATLKRLADTHTDFFDDLVHLFNAQQVARQFESDISVTLYPLPRVPVMICYWKPEDGLASSINIFFDETADKNLDIGDIFMLSTGMAQMFDKITQRHGGV